MVTLDEFKKRKNDELMNEKQIWENDPRGINNQWVHQALEAIESKSKNFDEYIKQSLVKEIDGALEAISTIGFDAYENSVNNRLEIKREDSAVKLSGLANVTGYASAIGISGIALQNIYESFGYTEHLPTKLDIIQLERKREMLDRTSPNYDLESNELDRQIAIAKTQHGHGLNHTFVNLRTPQEINDLYEEFARQLEAQKDQSKGL